MDQEVELETDNGGVASIGWDTPGPTESMRFRLGSQLAQFNGGALWDLSNQQPWAGLVGRSITDILLHYHPWTGDNQGFWCTRTTIVFDESCVELMLGGFDSPSDALAPAATSLAVLTDPASLPTWELSFPSVPEA